MPWPPIYHSYSSLVALKLPYIQKSVDGVLKQKEIRHIFVEPVIGLGKNIRISIHLVVIHKVRVEEMRDL